MSRPRVAAVSYINTKPLIYGLEQHADLHLDVPSRLIDGLVAGEIDVALLPVADIPTLPGAQLLNLAGICCEGDTLTVRIYSDRPLHQITTLLCDTDSHTSVQLARVILRENYGTNVELKLIPKDMALNDLRAPFLLIGDKVISNAPSDEIYPHQADLGLEWNLLTHLPFVFAAWTARPGYDWSGLAPILRDCLANGLNHIDEIVAVHAPPRHWPLDIAKKYLTHYLHYPLSARHLQAINLFWAKAGLLPRA